MNVHDPAYVFVHRPMQGLQTERRAGFCAMSSYADGRLVVGSCSPTASYAEMDAHLECTGLHTVVLDSIDCGGGWLLCTGANAAVPGVFVTDSCKDCVRFEPASGQDRNRRQKIKVSSLGNPISVACSRNGRWLAILGDLEWPGYGYYASIVLCEWRAVDGISRWVPARQIVRENRWEALRSVAFVEEDDVGDSEAAPVGVVILSMEGVLYIRDDLKEWPKCPEPEATIHLETRPMLALLGENLLDRNDEDLVDCRLVQGSRGNQWFVLVHRGLQELLELTLSDGCLRVTCMASWGPGFWCIEDVAPLPHGDGIALLEARDPCKPTAVMLLTPRAAAMAGMSVCMCAWMASVYRGSVYRGSRKNLFFAKRPRLAHTK